MTKTARGTITSFDGSQGIIQLDDGEALVFFRYSFESVSPAVGMAVQVKKSEPFYKGGRRATDVAAIGHAIDPKAAQDRSWAVDRWRLERARERAAREAEDRRIEDAVDRFNDGWRQRHPVPPPLTLAALFGGTVPDVAARFIERVRPLDSFTVHDAPGDPGFVPILHTFGKVLGFTVHPERPVELGLISRHDDVCVLARKTARADGLIELVEQEFAALTEHADEDGELPPDEAERSRDRAAKLEAMFSPRKPSRSDARHVSAWLEAVANARGRSTRKARDERSAVLLDLYRERDWSLLTERLSRMVEHCAHEDQRATAEAAFVRRERGKTAK